MTMPSGLPPGSATVVVANVAALASGPAAFGAGVAGFDVGVALEPQATRTPVAPRRKLARMRGTSHERRNPTIVAAGISRRFIVHSCGRELTDRSGPSREQRSQAEHHDQPAPTQVEVEDDTPRTALLNIVVRTIEHLVAPCARTIRS
jgi:hypothetical protein